MILFCFFCVSNKKKLEERQTSREYTEKISHSSPFGRNRIEHNEINEK